MIFYVNHKLIFVNSSLTIKGAIGFLAIKYTTPFL